MSIDHSSYKGTYLVTALAQQIYLEQRRKFQFEIHNLANLLK
jgi:hypothetical protein